MSKAKAPVKGQTFGVKRVRFAAREWELRLNDSSDRDEIDRRSRLGVVDQNRSRIEVEYISRDQAILTLLHEYLHIAVPGANEKQIESAEVVLKDALEASGVDLSPLLRGYTNKGGA